jgi:DNA repair protein RadC
MENLIREAQELSIKIYDALDTGALNHTITNPEDVETLLRFEMQALENEELRVVILNTRNEVMKIDPLYKGSVNQSGVRIGELFRSAIRENGSAIIVVHNHPSGDPNPSADDLSLTKEIIKAGKMLSIQVLDHLIIAKKGMVSINRRGGFDVDFEPQIKNEVKV